MIEPTHTHPPPVFYVNDQGEYVRIHDKMVDNFLDNDDVDEVSTCRVIGPHSMPCLTVKSENKQMKLQG